MISEPSNASLAAPPAHVPGTRRSLDMPRTQGKSYPEMIQGMMKVRYTRPHIYLYPIPDCL